MDLRRSSVRIKKYRIMGVVAVDTQHDLVLLQLSQVRAVPLKLGDVSQLETGEAIYALGNPEGLEGTISPGIVSGIRLRQIGGSENLMQITAPISHGSSGGPVVNVRGEVIGVAVSQLRDGQNLNFAVPAPYLALLMASMRSSPVPLSSTGADGITNTVPTRNEPARFTSGRYGISFIPPANSLEELNSEGLPKYTGEKNEFGPFAQLTVNAVDECALEGAAKANERAEEANERAEKLENQNLLLQTDLTKLQIELAETHERMQDVRRKLDPRAFTPISRAAFIT